MFDWNHARAFLATAEHGSLSAAARALGLSQPTAGRQVAAFEEEVGLVLFERRGNRLDLTPAGRALADEVRGMQRASERVALVATGQATEAAGTVRISASEGLSWFVLPDVVADLRRRHPEIAVHLLTSNDATDLQRREADIALRNFRPTQPDLVARRVQDGLARLYATGDYLDGLGRPDSPAGFARASFIGFEPNEAWRDGLRALGLPLTDANFPILARSHLVQWALCLRGLGVAGLMQRAADAEPRLQRALPELDPIAVPVWVVTRREVQTSPPIRRVFDHLVEALSGP